MPQSDSPILNEQSAPIHGPESVDIWPLVVKDMKQRNIDGTRKYGVPLRSQDGRISLIDAYQEALDLCVYLRKEIEERKSWAFH